MLIFVIIYLTCQVFNLAATTFQAHLSDGWFPKQHISLKKALAQYDNALKAQGERVKNGHIAVLIVPHAGYRFSGSVAAAGYRLLDKQHIKRVIILAPSHQGGFQGIALPFFDTYATPLGKLTVDSECLQKLAKNPLYQIRHDVWGKEHSLEVQLPFIQYYLAKSVRIVPLIIGTASFEQLESLAETLKKCIDDSTLVVVSSDFTHHGARFGYAPFAQNADVQASIKNLDHKIIDALIHKKAHDVGMLLKQTGATVCGRMPLKLFKVLQEKNTWSPLQGMLVNYSTSYAVTHEPIDSVSYATIIFTKRRKK